MARKKSLNSISFTRASVWFGGQTLQLTHTRAHSWRVRRVLRTRLSTFSLLIRTKCIHKQFALLILYRQIARFAANAMHIVNSLFTCRTIPPLLPSPYARLCAQDTMAHNTVAMQDKCGKHGCETSSECYVCITPLSVSVDKTMAKLLYCIGLFAHTHPQFSSLILFFCLLSSFKTILASIICPARATTTYVIHTMISTLSFILYTSLV